MVITLSQLLEIVYLVVGIFLCIVLYRLILILGDVKETSAIISKRAKEADRSIDKFSTSIADIASAIKGFVYSFGAVKAVKNKIDEFKKGEENEK